MAKTKETLFSKLQNEEAESQHNHKQEWRNSLFIRIAIIFFTLVICTLFYPSFIQNSDTGNIHTSNIIGILWNEPTLIAQKDFAVLKSQDEYKAELEQSSESVMMVFQKSYNSPDIELQRALTEIRQYIPSRTLSSKNIAFFESIPINDKKEHLETLEKILIHTAGLCNKNYFVNIPLSNIKQKEISVRNSSNIEELIVSKQHVIDSQWIRTHIGKIIIRELGENAIDELSDIVFRSISPTAIYSDQLTDESRILANQSVARYSTIIKRGETIVANGQRITKEIQAKLDSYYKSRYLTMDRSVSWLMVIGNLGYMSVIYSILGLFLFFLRPRIFNDNLQLLGLNLAIIVVAAMAWISVIMPSKLPLHYAVIIPSLAMITAILFDSRTAFYTTLTMALTAAGVRGNDFDIGLSMLSAGMLGAYTVRDVQSRTQIFRSIFFIFIGFAVPILSLACIKIVEINVLLEQILIIAFHSAFAPLITFGLLFIVERVFNITTNLRLQEFDNLAHPLLTELSEKAPGTYQHTLTIARIAEQAASVIGADALLTKVGAFYHDIGKIAKAEYFIENQINMDNKHNRLLPKKSASIIRDHVQEGIELAQEYKLPNRIINFIPTHHGTLLIKHFYAEAMEDAQEQGKEIDENDFRYPGPKPNSKETAIVMLADVAEALYRSLDTDDPDIIELALDNVFKERINDGQFDECEITLQDIHRIKMSFIKSLSGIHHHRIKYKELPQEED